MQGTKVALLVESGYQDLECWYPKTRLKEEGAEVVVASKEVGEVIGEYGYPIEATSRISDLNPKDFDAVLVPGGRECPDKLRTYESARDFVRQMDEEGKTVATICHAAWLPISAGVVQGRDMTCFQSIRDDLENAGANYRDEPVVVDGNMVTARHPGDLPQYCQAIIRNIRDRI